MNIYIRFFHILCSCLILFLPSSLKAQLPSCEDPACDEYRVGSAEVTFAGVRYNYPQPGQSTWYYCICSGRRPSISHVVFNLCEEITQDDILDAGTWDGDVNNLHSEGGNPSFGRDNSTNGKIGLKFDQNFRDNECRKYYFTLNKNYEQGKLYFISKAGNDYKRKKVCGPDKGCDIEDDLGDDDDDDDDDNDDDDDDDDDDDHCNIRKIRLDREPECERGDRYDVCLIVEGRGLPARPNRYLKVLVNLELATVTHYEKFDNGRKLRICLSGVRNRGREDVKIGLQLKRRCLYWERNVYDEPTCEDDDTPIEERCRISNVSLIGEPECQGEEHYGICLFVEGENLPSEPSRDLKVVVDHQPREISSYDVVDGGLRICLDELPKNGTQDVEVFVQPNSTCSYTARELYDEPSCRQIDSRCYLTGIELEYGRCHNNGTYDACFRVYGEYLPENFDSAKVVIKNQPYSIIAITDIDGGKLVCVRGVINEERDSVEVFIRLQEECSWTEWALYDEPDLNCGGRQSLDQDFLNDSDPSLLVYPNPSNGQFQLIVDNIGVSTIEIITINGERIYRQDVEMQTEVSIDLSQFNEGLYLVRLVGDGFTDIRRILIQE